jgi:hypothetical protein
MFPIGAYLIFGSLALLLATRRKRFPQLFPAFVNEDVEGTVCPSTKLGGVNRGLRRMASAATLKNAVSSRIQAKRINVPVSATRKVAPGKSSAFAACGVALDKLEGSTLEATMVPASAASSSSGTPPTGLEIGPTVHALTATPTAHTPAAKPPAADKSAHNLGELKGDMDLVIQSVDKLRLVLQTQQMPLVAQAVNKLRLELMVQAQATKLETRAELAIVRASMQRLIDEKTELNPTAAATCTSLITIEHPPRRELSSLKQAMWPVLPERPRNI